MLSKDDEPRTADFRSSQNRKPPLGDPEPLTDLERSIAIQFIIKTSFLVIVCIIVFFKEHAFGQEQRGSMPPGFEWTITQSDGWVGTLTRVGTKDPAWASPMVAFAGDFTSEDEADREAKVDLYISQYGRVMLIRQDASESADTVARVCTYLGEPTYCGTNFDSYVGWDAKQFSGEMLCSDDPGILTTWVADVDGREW